MKSLIYELPHEVPNDLRIRKLEIRETVKFSNLCGDIAQCSLSLGENDFWEKQSNNTQK